MNRFALRFWLLLMMMWLLTACSTSPVNQERPITFRGNFQESPTPPSQSNYDPATYSGVFQKPRELEAAVDFWRKTYTLWHGSEIAIHDDRYLDVIYEVVTLPGYVAESLTTEQKAVISQRRDFWKTQLTSLEMKLRYNAPLSGSDQLVMAKLKNNKHPLTRLIAGAADRVHSQRGIRERFKRGLEISGRYDSQFRKIFRAAGLPEELACLPHVESSFQPSAKSSAGAVGMWQFTKSAAKTFMPGNGRFDNRLDPIASAHGAARYLRHAYSKLGDWPTAITSYNHGIGGMKRAQNQAGRNFPTIVAAYNGPAFGFASRNYYCQFLAAREIVKNPRHYFPEGVQFQSPLGASQYLVKE